MVDITVKDVNHPPVADAGSDKTVQEGSPVVLDGSQSYDIDNDSLTYSWVQTTGRQSLCPVPIPPAPPSPLPLLARQGRHSPSR